jgi:hypothetical protein
MPAVVAAKSKLLFAVPLVSDMISADFFPVLKLLKSIAIDSAGGRTGGSPLSFLQPVNKKVVQRQNIKVTDISFFI